MTSDLEAPPHTDDTSPMRVIVDTDLSMGALGSEIDDGLALAMVVAEPRFDLQMVTTVAGNVDAASAAHLTADLLDRLGATRVRIYQGAMSALCDPVPSRPVSPDASNRASQSRPTPGYAAAEIARMVVESPGEITIIALGPLTNLAAAINLEPRFVGDVKEIVVMGGTYFEDLSWGSLPSEFNFWLDPEAAHVVLSSAAPVRLVGLDVTTRVQLSLTDAERLRADGGAFGEHAGTYALAWIERLAREYPDDPFVGDTCSLHDPLAVTAVAEPSLFGWQDAFVEIETHDPRGRGIAVVDRPDATPDRRPNCSIAATVDAAAARRYILGLLARL